MVRMLRSYERSKQSGSAQAEFLLAVKTGSRRTGIDASRKDHIF